MSVDSILITHKGFQTNTNIGRDYDSIHLINLHSIFIHNNFINIGDYL